MWPILPVGLAGPQLEVGLASWRLGVELVGQRLEVGLAHCLWGVGLEQPPLCVCRWVVLVGTGGAVRGGWVWLGVQVCWVAAVCTGVVGWGSVPGVLGDIAACLWWCV